MRPRTRKLAAARDGKSHAYAVRDDFAKRDPHGASENQRKSNQPLLSSQFEIVRALPARVR
jgi:hypothetical protein